MEIGYGIVISFKQFLAIMAKNKYGNEDISRLARDTWNELDEEGRESALSPFDEEENVEDIIRDSSIDLFFTMPYPEVKDMEVILLTRTSTHVFIGIVKKYDSIPNNIKTPFTKEQMQHVDDMLTSYNLDIVEAQLYITKRIEDSDAGNAEELKTLP